MPVRLKKTLYLNVTNDYTKLNYTLHIPHITCMEERMSDVHDFQFVELNSDEYDRDTEPEYIHEN